MSSYDSKYGRTVYPYYERIDNGTIKSICKKIKEQAEKLDKGANDKWNTMANLENVARDINSDKILTANGHMYHEKITQVQNEMTESYKDIKAIADEIISAADSRRNTENSQWNTYTWRLESEARQAQWGK